MRIGQLGGNVKDKNGTCKKKPIQLIKLIREEESYEETVFKIKKTIESFIL